MASTAVSTDPCAVMTITPVLGKTSLQAWRIWRPSIPGRRRSVMTISNGSFRIRSTPSRPVVATLTWHPSAFSASAIEIRMRGSSSMIRTFGCGIASGLLPHQRPDVHRGKPDGERGSLVDLTFDGNLPPMPFDDAEADGEPQACSLALAFGRKKRIEDLRQDVGRNPATGVLHFDRAPRP